jgi:transcriptional regulator with XRE-family HTH domain
VRRRYPICPEAFRDARHRLRFSIEDAARLLDVTPRTVRNWESGRARIPYAAFRLLRLHAGAVVSVAGWEGWHFGADGTLWSPEGKRFKAVDLAYLWLTFAQARAWRRRNRSPG